MDDQQMTPEQREQVASIGRLEFWNPRPFIEAASILVAADEPLRAIQLLDNLPGYYRDQVPQEVSAMKKQIYALLATPTFYVTNKNDQLVREENAVASVDLLLRGRLIEQDVKAYNDAGQVPHIVDLGPGEYWLPIGLKKKNYRFTYQDIGLCAGAREKAQKLLFDVMTDAALPRAPQIFVACELIEHLHHERDIRVEYERAKCEADILHLSTPKYTWDCRRERLDWQRYGDLGHLRTYTPNEFYQVVSTMFHEFNWTFYDSNVMHLKGSKR
jgi:hypothetical protein